MQRAVRQAQLGAPPRRAPSSRRAMPVCAPRPRPAAARRVATRRRPPEAAPAPVCRVTGQRGEEPARLGLPSPVGGVHTHSARGGRARARPRARRTPTGPPAPGTGSRPVTTRPCPKLGRGGAGSGPGSGHGASMLQPRPYPENGAPPPCVTPPVPPSPASHHAGRAQAQAARRRGSEAAADLGLQPAPHALLLELTQHGPVPQLVCEGRCDPSQECRQEGKCCQGRRAHPRRGSSSVGRRAARDAQTGVSRGTKMPARREQSGCRCVARSAASRTRGPAAWSRRGWPLRRGTKCR